MLPDFPDHQAPPQSLKAPFVAACLLHLCLVGCLGWFMSQSPLQRPIPLVSIELSASLIEGGALSAPDRVKTPDGPPQPHTADLQQNKHGQPKRHVQTGSDQGKTRQDRQAQTKLVPPPAQQANKERVEKPLQSKRVPQEPLKKTVVKQAPAQTAQATTQASSEATHQRTEPRPTPTSDAASAPTSAPISDSAPSPSESQAENSSISNTAPKNSPSASSPNKTAKGNPRAEKAYLASIVQKLHRSLRYPESAREKRLSGTTTVQFTINPQGQVSGERIHTPSGHPELDKEALALIKRAAPFRSIPTSLGHETMTLTVPIRFSLK